MGSTAYDGVRLDTEKAIKLGTVSRGNPARDLWWFKATLYVKRSGITYFLEGEGGRLSIFHKRSIHLLDREEAKAFGKHIKGLEPRIW